MAKKKQLSSSISIPDKIENERIWSLKHGGFSSSVEASKYLQSNKS